VSTTFTEPHERARAFGIYGAIAGGGRAIGLSEAEQHGWTSELVLSLLAGGLVLLALFVVAEGRVAHPLLPMRVLRDRNRAGALLSVGLVTVGMFGMFLFLTYYLQVTLGYSPVRTGLAFLPMTAGMTTGGDRARPAEHRRRVGHDELPHHRRHEPARHGDRRRARVLRRALVGRRVPARSGRDRERSHHTSPRSRDRSVYSGGSVARASMIGCSSSHHWSIGRRNCMSTRSGMDFSGTVDRAPSVSPTKPHSRLPATI
jgi:hypothetical protein